MSALKSAGKAGALLLGLLLLAGCHPDMWNQPKYKPQDETELFADRQSNRPLITGTVPRRQYSWKEDLTGYAGRDGGRVDEAFFTGFQGRRLVTTIPPAALARFDNNTKTMLLRGQYQFNTFCQPCHGRVGDGQGMIAQRGLAQRRQPGNFHSQKLRDIEIGHFYDVITNGFGLMYSYASRIEPQDRWAIAAYIRALQLSQNARTADIPGGDPVRAEEERRQAAEAERTGADASYKGDPQQPGTETGVEEGTKNE